VRANEVRSFYTLWAGRTIHAQSQNFPEQLAPVLARHACALIASPAHLKRLPDHLEWSGGKQNLRAVFSSGGPLPADVARSTGDLFGQTPIEVYGSSETGGIAWRQRAAEADDSWQPLSGVEWRVADDAFLEIRSPHLADAGWTRTADRLRALDGDRFMLIGRGDRIVKIEEKRISLESIQTYLQASPLVAAVRIETCDDLRGQRQQLAAFVILSDAGAAVLAQHGKLVLNRQLRDLLVGAVEPVAFPRRWRYLDEFPIDAQGKTSRAALLALLDQRPRQPYIRQIERNELKVILEMTVPADLYYFDGHFTDAPILPGVVQVDWVIANGRRYFGLPTRFCGISALKFQRVVIPNSVIVLELTHDAGKGSLSFRYMSPSGQHSSGNILFSPDPSL